MKKRKLKKPSARENRQINAGISRDADTYELSRAEFAELKPVKRGRPPSSEHKIPVTVRLDSQVVTYFRNSGSGWQTRMNQALVAYVARQRRG